MLPLLISVFLLTIISTSTAQTLPSLLTALNASGSSKFAALIASDPAMSAIYLSDQVQTVFAPTDDAFDNFSDINAARNKKRQVSGNQQQILFQASDTQSDIAGLRTPPGKPVKTLDKTGKLKGHKQSVVSDSRNATGGGSTKRWAASSLDRRQANASTAELLKIFSGLGNHVSIIQADIEYDGGLIQTVDDFFTLPQSLSYTNQFTGQTAFTQLTNSSNLTAIIDSTPYATFFIPTNEAFGQVNTLNASNTSSLSNLLSNHIIPNFVGYLPDLIDGSTYMTQAGNNLTVTVEEENYFINGALIVSANMILENGVAHVINQVLTPAKTPTSPPLPVFTGTGSSIMLPATIRSIMMACSTIVLLSLGF